jgi:outer membrane receptor protein involved in Fe transport
MSATRIAGMCVLGIALVIGTGAPVRAMNKSRLTAPVAAPAPRPPTPAGGAIGAIDFVTAEQIAATAATDIRAALALVPTLVIEDTGGPSGLATLSLRGSLSRQVLVLVDGHRVGRAPSEAFNINDLALTVERIVRIEVIPAPASLVYGPDAIGGVVNIVTLPAGVIPAFALSYGRGDGAEQRVAGGVQYGVKKLGLRLDGQWLSGDGFRDNADYDQKSIVVGLAVAPDPWGLDVRWTALARESGVPGPAAFPSPRARQKDAHDGLRADVVYLPGSGWDLKAGVFTRSQSLRFTDPAPPVVDPLVPATAVAGSRENNSNGFDLQLDFDTKNNEIYTVGAEWVNDRVSGEGSEDHAAERWSLYTQDQWRSGDWSWV